MIDIELEYRDLLSHTKETNDENNPQKQFDSQKNKNKDGIVMIRTEITLKTPLNDEQKAMLEAMNARSVQRTRIVRS